MDLFDSGDYHDKFSDYYSFIRIIDKGSFGTVVHALDKYSGEEVAVKIISKRKLKEAQVEILRQEATLMASLSHTNIVQFKHAKETRRRLFLEMEMIFGTNLHNYLLRERPSEQEAKDILRQILEGVHYIHRQQIVHRDIKPENILITRNKEVKITDFGLSTSLSLYNPIENEKCGTLKFMAPEQMLSEYYSREVDIWSCGLILYMLLAGGKHPLATSQDNKKSYLEKLKSPEWVFPDDFPTQAKSLYLKMVCLVPLNRYTAHQALKHPWFTSTETIPLTVFEEFKLYSDQVKLKMIALSVLFGSVVRPAKAKQLAPRPKVVILPKGPTRRLMHKVTSSKRTIIRVTSSSFNKSPMPSLKINRSGRRNMYIPATPV